MTKVAVLVGSLRRDSLNRVLAGALAKIAQPGLDLQIVEIGDLPIYNQDLEDPLPAPVERFKREIEAADAVLFVTPEFLRSPPAALKNAIEWGARGKNSWAGKPASIVGTSPGALGSAVAQAQLRPILPVLGMALVAQPEIYLQWRSGLIDQNGDVTDESTRALLTNWAQRFAAWIEQTKPRAELALAS